MPTTRETILAAPYARLSALPATVLRDEVLPERVPAEGLFFLRDGVPVKTKTAATPCSKPRQRIGRTGPCRGWRRRSSGANSRSPLSKALKKGV
ncbi:MAG: hypothetical protein ACK5II_14635 [Paracoccus sp. (in: a-proteobacteria)]